MTENRNKAVSKTKRKTPTSEKEGRKKCRAEGERKNHNPSTYLHQEAPNKLTKKASPVNWPGKKKHAKCATGYQNKVQRNNP